MGRSSPAEDQSGNQYALDFPLPTILSRGNVLFIFLSNNKSPFADMGEFGALVYRLNTYPLIHLGFLHAFFNAIALLPLLERFEAEHGTLLTGAMFAGRVFPFLKLSMAKSAICCSCR